MNSRKIEIFVGLFVALAVAAAVMLALKVADTSVSTDGETYTLKAKFDNVGGLKVRAPVKVGGVVIGRVGDISLDKNNFTPVVTMVISADYNEFPETSSASILTSGLLGEQYIGLQPGFSFGEDDGMLEDGDFIADTKSALVLEELIGQFLFSQGND
ncbi:putative phospholipid ABC transporter-binding protein MlaD [Saliniradius amylolyticus]|uniref:Putative phospholipid ABC transporter-binding protein MlaD n=1 Tax=Saliniradius amylolyticus TaxID=2183582 RepID=A0A2S2E5M7_9ALTE|nr:outer membrane lipid asymmetry maintenance protein MlaD [Saliniradius amylolyticus]AWL12956.1 putative phospholipid ABC transporter-binding protein MlaD [Saliniradius amylolyticus]